MYISKYTLLYAEIGIICILAYTEKPCRCKHIHINMYISVGWSRSTDRHYLYILRSIKVTHQTITEVVVSSKYSQKPLQLFVTVKYGCLVFSTVILLCKKQQ